MKPLPPESLSKKIVRGGIWVFALLFTSRGLGFVRTIILARLLSPSDFGLLGIAMLAIATLETFSQTGFQAALIQKKENVESFLDTAWLGRRQAGHDYISLSKKIGYIATSVNVFSRERFYESQ